MVGLALRRNISKPEVVVVATTILTWIVGRTTTTVAATAMDDMLDGTWRRDSTSNVKENNRNPEQDITQQEQPPETKRRSKNSNGNNGGFLRQSDYPFLSSRHNDQWTSVSKNVEFLPAIGDRNIDYNALLHQPRESSRIAGEYEDTVAAKVTNDVDLEEGAQRKSGASTFHYPQRKLEQTEENSNMYGSSSSNYDNQPFVEVASDYSSYQQAWRMLGFMIDCDANTNSYYSNNNKNNHNSNDNGDYLTGEGCQRYVIWAGYVDLDYQGGGIGEYQYWNRETNAWDDTSCKYVNYNNNNNNKNNNNKNNKNNDDNNSGESRCAKMDCHLPDTNWKLLGFYKHRSYSDWMEQLFKHEAMCIWSDDEYSFMKNARQAWPQGCTVSQVIANNGQQIYYDLKPTIGGGITVGLYIDTKCVEEYRSWGSNDQVTVENVVGNILANNGGSHDSRDNNNNYNYDTAQNTFEESLALWDESFDAFKICQPCVAHDLNNYGNNADDDASRGSSYGKYRYGYDDDYAWWYWGYWGYKGNDFDCYDDAGYTNVNQCMKFMAKTTMNTATFRDLALANAQGTLVDNPLSGYRQGSISYMSSINPTQMFIFEYLFLCVSIYICIYGLFQYQRAKRDARNAAPATSLKQPLVFA